MTGQDATLALSSLAHMPIEPGGEIWPQAWSDTSSTAEAHRLTVYDAAYLELALRRRLPLATLDKELHAAAATCGVSIA